MLQTLINIDHRLFHLINTTCANKVFDFIFPLLRNALTWIPFYILGILFVLIKYKRTGLLIVFVAVALIFCSDQLASSVIKPIVGRIRPCNNVTQHARLVIENCGGGFSMPSSHASNHFAIAVFIGLLFYHKKSWLLLVLLVWAFLISLAQVYVGVHYPMDVTAGALLGAMLGVIAFLICRRWLSPEFFTNPSFQAGVSEKND